MRRLDNARLGVWRDLAAVVAELERRVDEDLRAEWDIPLGWFEVLWALQRCGGRARPHEVARELRLPPSSVSRRLDRLQDEGWVARHRPESAESLAPPATGTSGRTPGDGRAVEVELTVRGRTLWRAMHVSYRRSVQKRFATHLDDSEMAAVRQILTALTASDGLADGPSDGLADGPADGLVDRSPDRSSAQWPDMSGPVPGP